MFTFVVKPTVTDALLFFLAYYLKPGYCAHESKLYFHSPSFYLLATCRENFARVYFNKITESVILNAERIISFACFYNGSQYVLPFLAGLLFSFFISLFSNMIR